MSARTQLTRLSFALTATLIAVAASFTATLETVWAKRPSQPPDDGGGSTSGYTMIDMGPVGNSYMQCLDINNHGQIVGYGGGNRGFLLTPEDADGDGNVDTWFRDDDGDGVNDLIMMLSLEEEAQSRGHAINDVGQVAGIIEVPQPNITASYHGFVYNPVTQTITDIGAPETFPVSYDHDGDSDTDPIQYEASISETFDINDSGQIVGHCLLDNDWNTGYAFVLDPIINASGEQVWFQDADQNGTNDLMVKLGDVYLPSINNAGEIACAGYDGAKLIVPATDTEGDLVWVLDENGDGRNDLEIPLPSLTPDGTTRTVAINDQGDICGIESDADYSHSRGVFWTRDSEGHVTVTELAAYDSADYMEPIALNNMQEVLAAGARMKGNGDYQQTGPIYYANAAAAPVTVGSLITSSPRYVGNGQIRAMNDAGLMTGQIGIDLPAGYKVDEWHAMVLLPPESTQ